LREILPATAISALAAPAPLTSSMNACENIITAVVSPKDLPANAVSMAFAGLLVAEAY